MGINYCLIDEENREAFAGVFPENMPFIKTRVAIGAVNEEGFVVGSVAYVLTGYEYEIDWIYVEPDFRRQGVGSGLLDKIFDVMTGAGDIFPITARFEFSTENSDIHSFFLSFDRMITSYSHERYYVNAADIKVSEKLHKPSTDSTQVVGFFDRDVKEQKKILNMLSNEQTYLVDDYDEWCKTCIPELCKCVFVNNNLVDMVILQKVSEGNLELGYLYGKYPRGLFNLLSATVSEMERLYPDAKLSFEAMNPESELLAKHLFPKAKTVHVYEAEG